MPTLPLPRTSLASLVCPSAPFLAPRLLRTCAPLAALQSRRLLPTPGRRYKTDAKPFKRLPVGQRHARVQNMAKENGTLLEQMRKACADRNLQVLMDLYPSLVLTGALDRDDTRRIAQMLHHCVRSTSVGGSRVAYMLPFVQQVVNDLKDGTLPPHPYAFVHLLGTYKSTQKYDEGHALWQWLVQRDDPSYLSQAVYGAAIELLAFGAKLPLPELERLYADTLKRFPGTFAEYHLSPNAIVPNRRQPVVIADLPVTLLQGILTARILAGDWKNSYLALDTALRLYPANLPTRFFELFMINRPLGEAYTVFLVACRGGTIVKPSHLTGLIAKFRKTMEKSATLREKMTLLRAIANAIYAYLEAGNSLESIHAGQLLSSFGFLLPELAPGTDYKGDMATLRNRIVTFAHGSLSSLLQAGMPPSAPTFTALVHLAGNLRVPDLFYVSLQDIKTAQLDVGVIGMRTMLGSAGQIGSKEQVEEHWGRIAHIAHLQGKQIDWRDWMCLFKACRRADHIDYIRTQFSKLEHAIPASHKDTIAAALHAELPPTEKSIELLSLDAFQNQLDELDKQIKNIAAVVMSGQRLDIRKTPFYMSLDPERPPVARREDLQTVYDEYTIDPHQPPPADSENTAAMSSTGIPLDELRFANWVSVVELMDQADALEKERQQALKDTGKDITKALHNRNPLESVKIPPLDLHSLRQYIKQLRSSSEAAQPPIPREPVGQGGIRKTPTGPVVIRTIPHEAEFHQPVMPQRKGNKPQVIHAQSPKNSSSVQNENADSETEVKPEPSAHKVSASPLEKGNNLQVLYHMYPSGTQFVPAPAAEPETPSKSQTHFSTKPGRLNYYVGLETDHVAPKPRPISRRPLGKAKSPHHHAFRRQPKDVEEEQRAEKERVVEEGAVEGKTAEDYAETEASAVGGRQ